MLVAALKFVDDPIDAVTVQVTVADVIDMFAVISLLLGL